jgi:ABC-type multidrug transport system fused ATPase/permease subunit
VRSSLVRSFRCLLPYWKYSLAAFASAVGVLIFNLLLPQLIRWIIDQGIAGGDLRLLFGAIAGLLALTLGRGVLTFIEGQTSETASQGVAFDLRREIQRKLTSLSFSFHDASETGELLSRAIQDVERVRFLTGRAALRLVESALMLAGTTAVLFWMQPRLAALAVLSFPLLIFQALRFGRSFRPLSLKIQKQLAVLTTVVEQNLRGSKVVKAYAQEQAEIARFDEENERWFKLSSASARLQSLQAPLLLLFANLASVAIIYYGGSLVVHDELSLGELVAFITYLSQLIDPVRRLGMVIPAVAIAASSAERVFEIIDAVPDVKEAPDAIPLPPLHGIVRFENVSFAYGRSGSELQKVVRVLKGVDFEAQPGQVIALLGQTGSGKSTIISLIPRFYDPTSGRILLDGIDLRQVTLQSLRTQIGIVMQETTLFAGSVRQNIAFGRPQASENEIVAAAQAAQAHDFILEMPQGYDTHVGERGVTLSGGQKQRLAIARALLLDPRILILDDATASVDTQTESRIQQAFERLMEGRTTFVIAHRLSTVRRADLILVLDGGQVAARGDHQTLLHTSPLYLEIFQRQLAPQESAVG